MDPFQSRRAHPESYPRASMTPAQPPTSSSASDQVPPEQDPVFNPNFHPVQPSPHPSGPVDTTSYTVLYPFPPYFSETQPPASWEPAPADVWNQPMQEYNPLTSTMTAAFSTPQAAPTSNPYPPFSYQLSNLRTNPTPVFAPHAGPPALPPFQYQPSSSVNPSHVSPWNSSSGQFLSALNNGPGHLSALRQSLFAGSSSNYQPSANTFQHHGVIPSRSQFICSSTLPQIGDNCPNPSQHPAQWNKPWDAPAPFQQDHLQSSPAPQNWLDHPRYPTSAQQELPDCLPKSTLKLVYGVAEDDLDLTDQDNRDHMMADVHGASNIHEKFNKDRETAQDLLYNEPNDRPVPNSTVESEFCNPGQSPGLAFNESSLKEATRKFKKVSCRMCGSTILKFNHETVDIAQRWIDRRPSLLGQMLCTSCAVHTCGGCGSTGRIDPAQDSKLKPGGISWCCQASRVFTIWLLLSAYAVSSQKLSELRNETIAQYTTRLPVSTTPHRSRRPRGVGYSHETDHHLEHWSSPPPLSFPSTAYSKFLEHKKSLNKIPGYANYDGHAHELASHELQSHHSDLKSPETDQLKWLHDHFLRHMKPESESDHPELKEVVTKQPLKPFTPYSFDAAGNLEVAPQKTHHYFHNPQGKFQGGDISTSGIAASSEIPSSTQSILNTATPVGLSTSSSQKSRYVPGTQLCSKPGFPSKELQNPLHHQSESNALHRHGNKKPSHVGPQVNKIDSESFAADSWFPTPWTAAPSTKQTHNKSNHSAPQIPLNYANALTEGGAFNAPSAHFSLEPFPSVVHKPPMNHGLQSNEQPEAQKSSLPAPSKTKSKYQSLKSKHYRTTDTPVKDDEANSAKKSPALVKAEKEYEAFVVGVLHLLCLALPSAERDGYLEDRTFNPLMPMISHSDVLDDVAELLRNDSIEDATNRRKVFHSFVDLVSQLLKHSTTADAILKKRPAKERRIPLFDCQESKKRETRKKRPEDLPSIAASMANLTKRSLVTIEHAKKNASAFGAEDEAEEMLLICRRMVELDAQVKSYSASSLNEKAKSKENERSAAYQWEEWQKNNCMLDAPDDAVMAGHVFVTEANSVTDWRKGRIKRIVEELATLATSLPPGIFVRSATSRPDILKALIIGPKDTPYEGGLFEFDVWCGPKYPLEPPKFRFKTTSGGQIRFNPNLYADGKVCLSLLGTWTGERWKPHESTLLQVLVSLQSMVFCENPYYNEPGLDLLGAASTESARYDARVRSATVETAMLGWVWQTAERGVWNDVVVEHFTRNRESIVGVVESWSKEKNSCLTTTRAQQFASALKIFATKGSKGGPKQSDLPRPGDTPDRPIVL